VWTGLPGWGLSDWLTTHPLKNTNVMKPIQFMPQTQILDTTRKRTGLLEYRIGTRNIRSLYKPGAFKSISDAVKKYKNVQIVALQEVRWLGEGDMRTNGMTIFYSGSSIGKHENGVGFLVNDQLLPCVKKFTPVNDRICHIRIAGKQYDILISVYSPTETGEEDLKDMFYDELERVYNGLSGHCLKIILGDFNSQVGRETVYRPTIGSESVHDMSNRNGTRLVEFAIANDLIVSSSFFPRKNINKYTWTSPRRRNSNRVENISYLSNI